MRIALVLLVASLWLPREAHACKCVPTRSRTALLAPADGAADVPTNARVWVGAVHLVDPTVFPTAPIAHPRLVRDDGSDVAATVTELGSAVDLVAVLSPEEPLEPGARYTVHGHTGVISTFTVGAGADTSKPAVPRVEDIASESDPSGSASCGPTHMLEFSLVHDGLLLVADRERTATLDASTISGEVTTLAFSGVSSSAGSVRIGRSLCSTTWPGADPGATTSVRFGAYDLAGNFSGFSEAVETGVPACGCGTTAGPGGALALALAALLRRRRV